MDYVLVIAAAFSGYLLGSVSFARLVVRLKTGGGVRPMDLVTPDGGGHLVSEAVSASAVRLQLGTPWGVLVGVLDVLKAFLPTLAWRLVFPEDPYLLVCGASVLLGHNWPVFHGFHGGNGQSVVFGGMLAIDWTGALATNAFALVVGLTLLRDGLVSDYGGIPLTIPWLWWRFDGDPAYIAYAFAVNIAWLVSFWPTLVQYLRLKRRGHLPNAEHSVVMFRMDFGFMRRLARRRYEEIDALIEGRSAKPAEGDDSESAHTGDGR